MGFEAILAFVLIGIVSLASLIGAVLISLKQKTLDKLLFVLVAFAIGTIFATATFDLIPEALHHLEELIAEGVLDEEARMTEMLPFLFIGGGFVAFFILERFIYWFHGHAHEQEEEKYVCYGDILKENDTDHLGREDIKSYALLNLIGDGLHNFLDGTIIMVSFLSGNMAGGLVVTIAVLFHEIPQEIGDFGILIQGGFKKKKALLFNFVSACIAFLGGIFAMVMREVLEMFNLFFLAFSGGGFLYIAAAELLPEMLEEKDLKKSVVQAVIFLLGIAFILTFLLVTPHSH
ncbi:MAG: ZIP family metal transporter [Candidatus Hodarchaeota archaeon]